MAHQSSLLEPTNLFLPLLLLLLPLLLLIFKHFKVSFSKSTPPLPPGPFPWPILGNILQLGSQPHKSLAKLSQTYGPLMSLKLGTQVMVVGSSKEAAMEILKTHDHILSGRHVVHVAPSKGQEVNNHSVGFVAECNKEWRHTRTTCQAELFTSKSIESQAKVREKKAMDMVRLIGGMEGEVVKVRDMAFGVVFGALSNVLVSRDLVGFEEECVDGKVSGLVREIVDVLVAPNVSDFFPFLGGLDLQGLRKKNLELSRRFHLLWKDVLEERRREKESGECSSSRDKDFLDALIEDGCSDDQINMMLMELSSAGSDTSSITIEWAMAEAIKNPQIMTKLQEELKREINKDQQIIKESQLNHLPYLQACVKETLRLHPPGPLLLPHRAIDTCQVMNYTIPKDSQVLVNFWAIGRDPKYWEDPLVFKPERFLDSNLGFKGNFFEYFPFSSGRRICPGMPMAAKQVPLVLACLIHFFDWSLPHGNDDPTNLDLNEKYALTVSRAQPLVLIPKARKW